MGNGGSERMVGGEALLNRQVHAQWERVRVRLRTEVGETAFRSWLSPISLADVSDGAIQMSLPTRFMRDWVNRHYLDRLRLLWVGENPSIREIELIVAPSRMGADNGAEAAARHDAAVAPANGSSPPPSVRGASPQTERRLATKIQPTIAESVEDGYAAAAAAPSALSGAAFPAPTTLDAPFAGSALSAPLDPRFTFENFVTGKPNELAFAAARRVAESPNVPFNPLFLYGGVGLGKTHLMHAIAWHIRRRDPERRVIYLSAEKFMYQFIRALRFRDTVAFKDQFRSVDVLMIDDVQFISGKDSTQEEFFHTFNALVDQNRQVIVSADKSPSDLEGLEERLRSRLGWGLVADLHPTTYELRLGILQMKAEQLGIEIPVKVMEFLAHKIASNVRELEGALNRIVAHSTLVGRAITLETTNEVLHDLLRANDRRVTVDEIQKRVAEHFNIKIADMSSPRRARAVARPRQVAMYLAKALTSRSLPEIGRKFGGRDHTTVMHAVRKIEELKASDPALAEDVELLRRMLEC